MNKILSALILSVILQIIYSSEISKFDLLERYLDGDKKTLFKSYHSIYNKNEQYPLDSVEGVRRYKIFKSNLKLIEEENSKDYSYKLGLTEFADMTNEEFRSRMLMKEEIFKNVIESLRKSSDNTELNFLEGKDYGYTPGQTKVDWGKSFGPVRNQGSCGSCWSFATNGAIEGNYKIQFGEDLVLSTQQLVDCDTTDNGCNGGWPTYALDYVMKNGVKLEKDYPYTSGATNTKGTCQYKNDGLKIVDKHTFCGFSDCNFDKWLELLKSGPLEIGLDAGSSVFQLYKNGVMNPTCKGANHAVVGYGINSDTDGDYLMIRNSWSPSWGENGNFRIRVNLANKTCFATDLGWLPIVKKATPAPPGPVPPVPPTPNDSCPIFYSECPYKGNSIQTCTFKKNLEPFNMSYSISSIKKGNANSIELFSDSECRGKSILLTSDEECLDWDKDLLFKKFNQRANSFVINTNNSLPPDDCVWVFTDSCYSSAKQEICSNVDDFQRINFDDRINSIQFGKNVKNVVAYINANYEGISYGFNKSYANMNQPNTNLFVNAISSLRIVK